MISSISMKVFESSGQNPFSLNSILVVGGGARSPLIQNSIKKAFGSIAGEQFVQEKLVIPKDELIEELTVLGATL
jgi:molecular chaperone DnaK (HSP70)